MSPEIIAIATVGTALAALTLTGQRTIHAELAAQCQDLTALRQDLAALRERMAHLEGLLEGLREALTRERAA